MCVGAIEGFSGRGDAYFEDMGTTLSASRDELDIFREATFDDNADEDHWGVLRHPYLFAPLWNVQGFHELHG